VQAQEFTPAKWALGLRAKGITNEDVNRELDDGRIVRTHILRPTWHFVAAADLRWMLSISGPRVHAANAHYYRKTGTDSALVSRSRKLLERSLRGGVALTRSELAQRFARGGIEAAGMQLAYFMMRAELDGLICSGPRRGKQSTYMLVDERVPPSAALTPDNAMAELVRRYFTSHGPATIQDFVWWSGMTVRQTKAALADVGSGLVRETIDEQEYWYSPASRPARRPANAVDLLPIYDEYLIAYKNRSAIVDPDRRRDNRAHDGYGQFLMIDGMLSGTWRMSDSRSGVDVTVSPYRKLSRPQRDAAAAAAKRLGDFFGRAARQTISPRPSA
jgi:hypothetical protein